MTDTEEILYRSATLEVAEDTPDEWILRGLAVPYNSVTKIGDYSESFVRGAFSEVDTDLPIYWDHNHLRGEAPIGKITAAEESEAGLSITAKISKTVRGTEVYQLLKDGVLRNFSVGFKPRAHKIVNDVVVRTKAALFEVSVVAQPAYLGAVIAEVRNETSAKSADEVNTKENKMTDSTNELIEVRNEVEDLSRRFSVLESADKSSIGSGSKFRSYGEFVKGLATREATAADAEVLVRAYTGATTTDSNIQVPWVNKSIELIAQNRNVLELFQKQPLPATGMSFEYPKFSSKSGSVAVQVNEGDDLTYNEVIITDAAVPVKTYGGYSQISKQAIQRSSVAYLDVVLRNLQLEYAKATNSAVRTALTGGTYTNTHDILNADKGKGAAWVDTVIDADQQIFADTGLKADVWVMSSAHFRALATIVDSAGRPVFVLNGDGVNSFGDVNARGLVANVGGLRVVADAGLSGNFSYIVNSEALIVAEDGSKSLQDENIINLTEAFSIYGYLAVAVSNADAVVKVEHKTA